MFQFSCRFVFVSIFRLSNRTQKLTRILTVYQANAATLTPLSKEHKISIKSLQECKGYNAWQFITVSEQRLDKEQHQQAAGEVQKCRQASGQRQTQSAYWQKRPQSWVAVAESGTQTPEPSNSQRNFTWGGDPSIISFGDYSQRSASQVLQEKTDSTADWSA